MFKKALIPALALTVASVALPAMAQSYGHPNGGQRHNPHQQDYRGWQSINQRQANLDRRIDMGLRNGQLSRREAARLSSEFNAILRLEANYRRGGLTQWERSDLDRRFDRLSAHIRAERRDRDNRRH